VIRSADCATSAAPSAASAMSAERCPAPAVHGVSPKIAKPARTPARPGMSENPAPVTKAPQMKAGSDVHEYTRVAAPPAISAIAETSDGQLFMTTRFVKASGGTLFLDEIGELPLPLQPKLLRALQEHRVRPVGADEEVAVNVRIVAASNRDLEAAVEERRFREDLYYRINVIHVAVPPLRARGGDILMLAQHFLERFAAQSQKRPSGFTEAAAARLLEYPWPGNVRELSNSIERAVALSRGDRIDAADLPDKVRAYQASHVLVSSDDPSELVSLEEVERRYIERVVEATQGNKSEAARILGLDRKTLHRKLEQYKPRG